MIQYKGIEFDMIPTKGYEQYRIIGKVGSISIDLHSTDAWSYYYIHEEYDWVEEDYDKQQEALGHVYYRIKEECKGGKYAEEYVGCGFMFEEEDAEAAQHEDTRAAEEDAEAAQHEDTRAADMAVTFDDLCCRAFLATREWVEENRRQRIGEPGDILERLIHNDDRFSDLWRQWCEQAGREEDDIALGDKYIAPLLGDISIAQDLYATK